PSRRTDPCDIRDHHAYRLGTARKPAEATAPRFRSGPPRRRPGRAGVLRWREGAGALEKRTRRSIKTKSAQLRGEELGARSAISAWRREGLRRRRQRLRLDGGHYRYRVTPPVKC